MDQDIVAHLRQRHNVLIGERMAEEVKIAAGSAYGSGERSDRDRPWSRSAVTGLPAEVEAEQRRDLRGDLLLDQRDRRSGDRHH